jgi:hypothetical protein
LVTDQFPVFNFDGYTKRSGETSFSATVWKDGEVQLTPVSISEIGSSGEYKFRFTPNLVGWWKVEILVDFNKDVFASEYSVIVGSVEQVYEMVRRLLGLSHENIFIDNTVYDANGQMIAARIRIFDTKENCEAATDGGTETAGLIATYSLDTVWEAINEFQTFRQVIEGD